MSFSTAATSLNWEAVRTVSKSQIVADASLASAEIGVVVADTSLNTYPDEEEIRIIWGEEMALGIMVGVLRQYEDAVKSSLGPKELSTQMKTWVRQVSCCPMKWHAARSESGALLAGCD